jgi:hypothetical protein
LIADGAVRDGNSGEERSTEGACDAWENCGNVAVLAEEVEFFGSTAVKVWVALFETEDGLSLLHCSETHLEEFLLCCVCVAWEFAGDFYRCPARNKLQDTGRDELIG